MRRFNFDEEDPDNDEIDHFLDPEDAQFIITPEQYKDLIEEESALYAIKLRTAEQKINFKILLISINMLKKSFWWKFKTLNTKLNNIEKTYKTLSKLIQIEEEK
jgi:hypothetical protein